MRLLTFALALAPLLAAPLAAQETHPFSVDDMLAMERISDPQVAPQGDRVLFTVRSTDLEANRGRTDVWMGKTDGSETRRLTEHPENDWGARWLPDGRGFVFLSTRGGSSQVYLMAAGGGEARQLTDLPVDVDNVLVFPDGKRLLLTLEVHPGAKTLAESAGIDARREASKVQARIYEELPVRHWDTWEDHKRSHVFVLTLGGGEPVDLMAGLPIDAPTKPFGGAEELAISPDGTQVVFVAKPASRERAWNTNLDLWLAPADGSTPPRNLTAGNLALDNLPAFSPDGATLAYVAMERPGYESDRQRVVLLDWKSGNRRVLTESWDRSPGSIAWSADGKRLYVTADDLGQHSIFAIDVADGKVTTLVGKGSNSSPSAAAGAIVYLHDNLRAPAELFALPLEGGAPRAITHLNAERVAAARMGEYEQFRFEGAGGATVHGFLVKPVDFDPAEKYPLAFLIHGGPQGSFGDKFHYRWNPQAYAGAGYAAVMIDFHGSTGYGQAFTDAIRTDWGGKPYEDLMKGLDAALERYPFLDGTRVAALGASYGGYMINWIAGQTERFRCLVNHDGVFDHRSMYYETEELWFPEWEHGGVTPWESPEAYGQHNPIDHVERWKTPMLVIHGERDHRVPVTQGLAAFTALQRRGVPSRLLYFPDENHWVLKPRNSILWHQTVLGWMEKWTSPAGDAAPTGKSPAEEGNVQAPPKATPPARAAGGVRGVARLEGERPQIEPLSIEAQKSKGCTQDGAPVSPLNQSLLLSKDGGIANVVVQVLVAGAEAREPEGSHSIDQVHCLFEPHVVVLPVGSTLAFLNSDDVSHNVNTYPRRNDKINRIVAPGAKESQKLEKADEIKVTCDLHPWMSAYVIVSAASHFAVTDAEGRFELAGLPPGEHEVEHWHETLGKGKTRITVRADGTAEPLVLALSAQRPAGRPKR